MAVTSDDNSRVMLAILTLNEEEAIRPLLEEASSMFPPFEVELEIFAKAIMRTGTERTPRWLPQ